MGVAKKSDSKYIRTANVDVAIQIERAYQRQEGVNENSRRVGKRRLNKAGRVRYFKSVGLGFKTPKAAINGKYIDKKCPFTGNVAIRGRIIRAQVASTKMKRSIIIRRNYLHWINKYQRYMKRHKNFAVHCSPCFDRVKVGDDVVVGQCRPLSKTIRYNVLEHIPRAADNTGKKFAKH